LQIGQLFSKSGVRFANRAAVFQLGRPFCKSDSCFPNQASVLQIGRPILKSGGFFGKTPPECIFLQLTARFGTSSSALQSHCSALQQDCSKFLAIALRHSTNY
jgi:hypothetical protein